MINWLIKIIVRKELKKIDARTESQFYDRLCNKYNNGQCFLINKK
jgi:hypothetical protein